jgi:hypothetical protein
VHVGVLWRGRGSACKALGEGRRRRQEREEGQDKEECRRL